MQAKRNRSALYLTPGHQRDATADASLANHAYSRLRDAIQEGRLKPGDRIMETELAGWLNMSRTPIRDALRRLQADGIMVHEPKIGLVVRTLDRQSIMELYVMREVLEGTAARLCARHAADIEISHLLELTEMERGLQGNYAALARHNRRFHEAVHRSAHNRYLEETLHVVYDRIGLLGQNQMFVPERANASLHEHVELVQAIEKRDAEAAADSAQRHVRAAQRERLKHLFPDG